MTKLLDNLTAEISKLKDQRHLPVRGKGPNDFAPWNPNFVPYNRRGNPLVQILRRERNQGEDQRIRAPFQNAVLEEELEFIEEEGEAGDNIHCMEDEVDYSFLTQEEYEEALIDEQITEEVVYQADGQGGNNLRSRLVAPLKKNVAPIKQLYAPARKVVVLPKKVVVSSKTLLKPAPLATPSQVQLKPKTHEVRFPYKLHYAFNL